MANRGEILKRLSKLELKTIEIEGYGTAYVRPMSWGAMVRVQRLMTDAGGADKVDDIEVNKVLILDTLADETGKRVFSSATANKELDDMPSTTVTAISAAISAAGIGEDVEPGSAGDTGTPPGE